MKPKLFYISHRGKKYCCYHHSEETGVSAIAALLMDEYGIGEYDAMSLVRAKIKFKRDQPFSFAATKVNLL